MKRIIILASIVLLIGFLGTASADIVGNDIIDRSMLDGATDIAFIDPTLAFPTDGSLVSFSAWLTIQAGDPFFFQVYRYSGTPNSYNLVFQQNYSFSYSADMAFFNLSLSTSFNILAGDILGWWFGSGGGVIPYDVMGTDDVEWTNYLSAPITYPVVGYTYSFDTASWARSSQKREYSIAAEYTPAQVPDPFTIILLSSGLIGLAGLRKKYNKQ
ncbi:MAG: hypothetical protein JXB42_07655 [Deltaproteobacteria bacterium]|nr:hypothetical protein [Deltaproteobacteria bacterium]